MSLSFKNKAPSQQPAYKFHQINPLQQVVGAPITAPTVPAFSLNFGHREPPPIKIPGEGLPRALNYLADYGGCGYYRIIAAEFLLNLNQKACVTSTTSMILDPRYYRSVSVVKIQRQATIVQKEFIKALRQLANQTRSFKIIYEIDDIVFHEDIPDYNRSKEAFLSPEIRESIKEIMSICDEITVTCPYMQEYYREKTGNQNITVIPNYLPKFWFDRYYDEKKIEERYHKQKKKPRVCIFASGTHVDVLNKTNQNDDFTSIVPYIIKTRKDFQWCFYGTFPLPLKPYIDMGEMEFHPWAELLQYPDLMNSANSLVNFAALQDNVFNRSKSNIKFLEAAALGIPCVCPDIVTYNQSSPKELLYQLNGSDFIDVIKNTLKDENTYLNFSKTVRSYADTMWLDHEENLMKHFECYFEDYQSPKRKFLHQLPCNRPKVS